MALKSTVFKAALQVADMDRHHYDSYALTLARHPSETDERMMVRLLVFAVHAHPRLEFGAGVSTEDEPDLWLKDLTGAVETEILLGQPDPKRLRQACARAERVFVYTYSGHGARIWHEQHREELRRLDKLTVKHLPPAAVAALGRLARRNMTLQATIQDGQIWLSNDADTVLVEPAAG